MYARTDEDRKSQCQQQSCRAGSQPEHETPEVNPKIQPRHSSALGSCIPAAHTDQTPFELSRVHQPAQILHSVRLFHTDVIRCAPLSSRFCKVCTSSTQILCGVHLFQADITRCAPLPHAFVQRCFRKVCGKDSPANQPTDSVVGCLCVSGWSRPEAS